MMKSDNNGNGNASNEATAYLAAIVESSDDAIISKNLQGIVTSWNNAAERIFGYTSVEAIGNPLARLIIPSERIEEEGHILADIRNGKKVDHFQTVRHRKDGSFLDVSITVSPIRNNKGEIIGASKIARDISERKRHEEEINLQRQWLEVTLASIGDAVIATDETLMLTYLNPVAEKLTGWTHQEAAGKPIGTVFNIINEDDRLPVPHPLDEIIKTGKIIILRNQVLLISKDGTEYFIENAAAPIHLRDGKLIGAVLVFHDIGHKRMLERELQRKAETLAEKDRRKDEFLAMLAHELRNPLAPVSNAIQIARTQTINEKTKQTALDMASQQITHMVRLLDDLLDASRITHGKISLRSECIDICETTRQAIDTASPLISTHRHTLQTNIPTHPIWVMGDATRLAQLFANLLNNATKYTQNGGLISLTMQGSDNEVVVSIKDNGIGIARHQLPYIFDMFTQVDNSMERTYGGLGIGLTLVKSIVTLHSGNIDVHSKGKDKGTEFTVKLPLAEKEKQPQAQELHSQEHASPSYQVLVVDDNEASAKTLGLMMESLGHKVAFAYNALAALSMTAQFKPDVVLLDIGMPDMNGYELCQKMRRDPTLQKAVFIAQTGWGEKQHLHRAKEAGFDFHLTKPISFDTLQHQLGNIREAA